MLLKTRCEQIGLLILLGGVSAFLLIPLASNLYVPNILDIFNHLVGIIQAKKGLLEGQFLLRTEPHGHYSTFRYPFFQFYSPTSYMIAGAIYRWIVPFNPYIAFKLSIWCAFVVGGIYLYRLALWLVASRPAAILAAVVYLAAPYNIIVINHLVSLTESIALGVIPSVIFYTLQRYYHPYNDGNLLKMAFVWYLLATIHLITFICTSVFVFIFLMLITIKKISQWKNMMHVGIAYLLSCMLAIWYLGPIVLFYKTLYINELTLIPLNRYPSLLTELLAPLAMISKIPHQGLWDVISEMHPSIGLPILMAVFLCTYLWISKRLSNKTTDFFVKNLLILFFLIFFIIWSPFNFWKWLPSSFEVMQYTWRLMGQAEWIGALLFAFAIHWIFNDRFNKKIMGGGIILILLASMSWLSNAEHASTSFKFIFDNAYSMFNPDVYLVNFVKNGADKIDEVDLKASFLDENDFLKTKQPVVLQRSMFHSGAIPFLQVVGVVSEPVKHAKLSFFIDKQYVKTINLKPGQFHWRIPLSDLTHASNNSLVSLQFKTEGMEKKSSDVLIKIKEIYLAGFLAPNNTLFLKQIPNMCQQSKAHTICKINVPPGIEQLELPVFYYHDMLNILVNGKPVAYESILQGRYLIAGIKPEVGVENVIDIQFRGLLWANFLSSISWLLWVLSAVFLMLQMIQRRFIRGDKFTSQ
jgi:hypothetical protein